MHCPIFNEKLYTSTNAAVEDGKKGLGSARNQTLISHTKLSMLTITPQNPC